MSQYAYLAAIDQAFAEGKTVDQINDDIIEPQTALTDDQKAALWLYAWSTQPDPSAAALEQLRMAARDENFGAFPFPITSPSLVR